MAKKMKTTRFSFLLVTLFLTMSTLAAVIVYVQNSGNLALEAQLLSGKPEKYFELQNPDSHVLEAISSQKLVFIEMENTDIDELIEAHETNNIFCNNNYYEINLLAVDYQISGVLGLLALSWIVFGVVTAAIVVVNRHKNPDK